MRKVDALDPLRIQDLLFQKMADLAAEPRFLAECARAEREFFGGDDGCDPAVGADAARFTEWYLLERESEGLGDVPARVLPWPEGLEDALLDSRVGVYMVLGATPQEVLVEDLQDDSHLEVAPIQGADVLAVIRPGDLLVGRLFPDAMDRHVASCAMAVQRQAAELAEAFRKDVARLDLRRRLTQAELEHLMFRNRPGPRVNVSETPVERLEAELDSLFRSAPLDLEGWSATAISQALSRAERPGIVVDPILERVAFDSKLDIARVQRLLLELWGAHRQKAPGTETASLGQQLATRIEAGLARNEDLEDVFAEVGEWIGEDLSEPEWKPEPGPKREMTATAGSEPQAIGEGEGDLAALVSEYCWETQQTGHDRMILDRLVRLQQELPLPQLELERLTSRDLARLLLQIYLEAAPQSRAAEVEAAFAALDRFYRWCVETQAMELEVVIQDCRQDLVGQVPRLQAAGLALSVPSGRDQPLEPAVSRVARVDDSRIELTLERAPDPVTLAGGGAAGQNLREGDILLGSLERDANGGGTFVGMVVALPPIAADLIG